LNATEATPPARQLPLLAVFAAFSYPYACVPFLWFYFVEHGITQPQYGTLVSAYYVTMVAVEIPTGLLADRYGKRLAMALGPALLAAGFTMLWLGRSFGAFLAGEVVLGLGHSVMSGPPSALLFETLRARGEATDYHRHESRLQALRLLGTAVSFLGGGFVAAAGGFGATIPVTAALCLCASLAAFGLRDVRSEDGAPLSAATTVLHAWRDLRTGPVLWMLAYFVLLFVLLRFPFHTYQPYLNAAGAADPVWIGVLFCALNLVAAPFSRASPWFVARFGTAVVLGAMPAILAVSLAVMAGEINALGIALFFLHQVPFGMHQAVVQDFVQHRIASAARATVLSTLSFAGRLAFALVFPWFLGLPSIGDSYLAVGLIGIVATIAVMLAGRRFL
jgi:MFS family permease